MKQLHAWALAGVLLLVPAVRAGDGAAKPCPSAHCDGWILSPVFLGEGTPLSTPIARFEAHDTPLREVLNQLLYKTDMPLIVDVEAILERGIDLDQPVTITVQNIPLNMLLAQLLVPCGLGWEVKEGEVHIGPQPEEPEGGVSIGKALIKLKPEVVLAFARSKAEASKDPKLSNGERWTLFEMACLAYNHILSKDPDCTEAQTELLALIESAPPAIAAPPAPPSCGLPCEYGCGACTEASSPPDCGAKQEPACYPDVAKCSDDCVPATCTCPSGLLCGGARLCKIEGPLEQCCSCCSACMGSWIGSMLGCGVDHPVLGAWIGGCVSALSPVMGHEERVEKAVQSVQPCSVAPPPLGCYPPPLGCYPPPMPPPMAMMPAPPPGAPSIPPMDGNLSWTLSKGAHGICISAPGVEGRCDSVSFGPDGCIVLQGHVHLKCHKDGNHAEVLADRAWVHLPDMSVQITPQAVAPMPPYGSPACWWGGAPY